MASSKTAQKPLTKDQKRQLRGMAQALDPIVFIGQQGLSPAVVKALDEALKARELVKVRIGNNAEVETGAIAEALCRGTQSQEVHRIGHVLVFYRAPKRPADRLIKLVTDSD